MQSLKYDIIDFPAGIMQERSVSVYIFRYYIYNIISTRVASSCVNSGSWSNKEVEKKFFLRKRGVGGKLLLCWREGLELFIHALELCLKGLNKKLLPLFSVCCGGVKTFFKYWSLQHRNIVTREIKMQPCFPCWLIELAISNITQMFLESHFKFSASFPYILQGTRRCWCYNWLACWFLHWILQKTSSSICILLWKDMQHICYTYSCSLQHAKISYC